MANVVKITEIDVFAGLNGGLWAWPAGGILGRQGASWRAFLQLDFLLPLPSTIPFFIRTVSIYVHFCSPIALATVHSEPDLSEP